MANVIHGRRQTALPPAGHRRREELSKRADDLAEQMGTIPVNEGGHVDPRTFKKVEPELAQHFNSLYVSNADPCYAYCWSWTGGYGRMVRAKQAEGWEIVHGESEEATELKGTGADTTRRLGDVILMRIPLDRKKQLDALAKAKSRRFAESSESNLMGLADRYAGLGVKVRRFEDPAELRSSPKK
jgi:hypothetical protein